LSEAISGVIRVNEVRPGGSGGLSGGLSFGLAMRGLVGPGLSGTTNTDDES